MACESKMCESKNQRFGVVPSQTALILAKAKGKGYPLLVTPVPWRVTRRAPGAYAWPCGRIGSHEPNNSITSYNIEHV